MLMTPSPLGRTIRLSVLAATLTVASPGIVGLDARVVAGATFKLAFYNIKSGFGQVGLAATPRTFANTDNCTNKALPLNAWGAGVVQAELKRLADDPAVVSLGLAEAWTCATPAAVRAVLGWKATSADRNGVAIVARYGFAGPEQWTQLDTSRNPNPSDTKWVLRVPVCLDPACSNTVEVFTTHWFASSLDDAVAVEIYERQAQQTLDFLRAVPAAAPHVLLGDLNVFDGTRAVCEQTPKKSPLKRLSDAGYVDAWMLTNPQDPGYTGMWNRVGCGVPAGGLWKRIDYGWSRHISPTSMARFGMVEPGHDAPSDHAGIVVEYPTPGAPPPPYITADVPLAADMDADARADLIVWSVSTGTWKWVTAASGFSEAAAQTKQWGNQTAGDVPLLGDIDGDGRSDLTVWRASTGTWYWLTSSSGYDYAAAGSKQWGNQSLGDVPMLADMDGDGRTELIVWRESTGVWYWLTGASGYDYAFARLRASGEQAPAEVPLLGRFDSDAETDLAKWTTTNNDPIDQAKAYFAWESSAGATGLVQWGTRQYGDRPLLADLDGDSLSDAVVWRPTDGNWYWLRSTAAYAPAQQQSKQWGNTALGDRPLAGDVDGDGRADLLIWRASSRTWYWLTSASGYSYSSAGLKPWS